MLTKREEKLAEALGLAMAAESVTKKVEDRVDERRLVLTLRTMRDEALETQARVLGVAERYREEDFWEIQAEGAYVQRKAGEMANAWFKLATDGVQAFQFLAMGEAGEVATWLAVSELNRGYDPVLADLCGWSLEVQRRHLADALDGIVLLTSLPRSVQDSVA